MNMDAQSITTIISSLGFPIFCCLALGYWIKVTTESFNKQLDDTRKEHKEETNSLKDSIDNNTIVLTKLLERMEKD